MMAAPKEVVSKLEAGNDSKTNENEKTHLVYERWGRQKEKKNWRDR